MNFDATIHHRHSVRLKSYDYTQPGGYFITIVSNEHECIFGNIVDGKMMINEIGKRVEKGWLKTAEIRENVIIDEFVIMPNHLHGIIIIADDRCRGTEHRAPTNFNSASDFKIQERFGKPTSNSIPTIVRFLKPVLQNRSIRYAALPAYLYGKEITMSMLFEMNMT